MSRKHSHAENVAFQHGSCLRKKRYITYKAAIGAAGAFKRHTGQQMRAYKCAFCSNYHITKDGTR